MQFEGRGIFGYDNLLKEYVYAWTDSMGTGIMTGTGHYDAAKKELVYITDNAPDPLSGKLVKMKSVSRDIGPDGHEFEMFSQGPDGSWWKTMEMTYTPAK